MKGETIIGDNKFVWDGEELRIYEIDFPVNEIILSKEELRELIAMNEFISGIGGPDEI